MDKDETISVEKAIVHVIDQSKNKKRKILSNYELEINDSLETLMIKHVNESFKNNSRIFAKFCKGENIVRDSCIKILENDNNFIEESKIIATHLFNSMNKTNASSANLLIFTYCEKESKSIGILKLDFDENFFTKEITGDDGSTKVVVIINGNGFNKNQKLRKCAIIDENIKDNLDSPFLLLDTQNTNDQISTYFKVSFLNCELLNDEKTNTRNMVKEINNYINQIYKDEPKKMMEKTYDFTAALRSSEMFDLDNVAKKVFDNDEERNKLQEIITNKKIDPKFKINVGVIQKKLNNRKIVTENGICLKAKDSLFNESDIEIVEKENGLSDIIIHKVKIEKNNL